MCYVCGNCGGITTAWAYGWGKEVREYFPMPKAVAQDLPAKAKAYLSQAIESLSSPAAAVMVAASAVDAMLKAKGYKEGTLYERIEKAAKDHLITDDMAKWAHQVRLEANDQRHADEEATLPMQADAEKVVDFAQALGQFLFVLPAQVTRGLQITKPKV